MTGAIRQLFRKEATQALLSSAAFIVPALSAANTGEMPVKAPDTIVYKILKQSINPNTGETSLTVDASSMKGNVWAIVFDKITKAAIMTPDEKKDSCPFIDIYRYNPQIEQVTAKSFEFNFKAKVSPEDAKRATDANCLVINIPSTKLIQWKEKPDF